MVRFLNRVASAVPVAVAAGVTLAAVVWAVVVYRLPEPQRSSQATYGAFLVAIIVGLPALLVTVVQILTAAQQRLSRRAAPAASARLTRPETALERWTPVTKGTLSSALLRLTTTMRPNHPGYGAEPPGKERPTVTLAVAFAALPPKAGLPMSALEDMLADIVTAEETAAWVASLTADVPRSHWTPWDASGKRSLCSVLVDVTDADPAQQRPLAWARLNLPDAPAEPLIADESMKRLSLVVQLTPLDQAGDVAAPGELEAWVTVLRRGLAASKALAVAAQTRGYQLLAEPRPEVAVCLKAEPSLARLVETGTLNPLPGNQASTWALLSASATADGSVTGESAVALVRHLCDHALHVRGYEARLSRALRPRRQRTAP